MPSDLTTERPLARKEWEARKSRIGAAMGDIATFTVTKIKEILPDVRAIKEKKLWKMGDYTSFGDFCHRGIGVTRQRIYQLLSEDETASKVLEIKDGLSNYLTNGDGEPAAKKTEPEQEVEPPPKPKKAPAKVDRMKAANAREVSTVIPATVTASEAIMQARASLTENQVLDLSATVSNRVAEHTGLPITESEDCDLALRIADWLRAVGVAVTKDQP